MFENRSDLIKLERVNLGTSTVAIPVARFAGQLNKAVVITAGMDGDEYAGIAAAYQLIDYFAKHPPRVTVIIIPVVNIFGFEQGTSLNPADGKYPKYIYPGKPNGSPTERLVAWLSQYTKMADLWIDLHSAALTETLVPFVWAWQTKNKAIDGVIKKVLVHINHTIMIFQKPGRESHKTDQLARHNTAYLLLESGERGGVTSGDVARHKKWVIQAIEALLCDTERETAVLCYRKVIYHVAPERGLWQSQPYKAIAKGAILGTLQPLIKDKPKLLTAQDGGIFLWGKATAGTGKGDILCAMASEIQPLNLAL